MRAGEPPRPLSRLAAMGGRTQISLLACLFALGLAGCGSSSGTIPPTEAGDLIALLDTMQEDVDEGQCEQVPGTAEEIADRVKSLPSAVDDEVKQELEQASARLDELATKPGECDEVETGASSPEQVETTTSTTTEEEPTTTTSTEEEEPTTSTEEEEPTTTESPSGSPGQSDEGLTPPSGDEGPSGSSGGDTGGGAPPSGGVGAGGSPG